MGYVEKDTWDVKETGLLCIYIEGDGLTPAKARKILVKAMGQLDKLEVKAAKAAAKVAGAKSK